MKSGDKTIVNAAKRDVCRPTASTEPRCVRTCSVDPQPVSITWAIALSQSQSRQAEKGRNEERQRENEEKAGCPESNLKEREKSEVVTKENQRGRAEGRDRENVKQSKE